MRALTYALALLAALRATRFITTDSLGEWTLVGPAKMWAWNHEGDPYEASVAADAYRAGEAVPTPSAASGWRSRLVKGLDCPFCVGFWITGVAVVAAALANRGPRRRAAFNVLAGAVGANYLTGHVSARLDG